MDHGVWSTSGEGVACSSAEMAENIFASESVV
jgi:hypothetical protein